MTSEHHAKNHTCGSVLAVNIIKTFYLIHHLNQRIPWPFPINLFKTAKAGVWEMAQVAFLASMKT